MGNSIGIVAGASSRVVFGITLSFLVVMISNAPAHGAESVEGAADGASCKVMFTPVFNPVAEKSEILVKVLSPKESRRVASKAIPKFNAYFNAINERVLERKNLVDLAKVALIAEEHLLLMGPPGNAKSQLSDLILGNIVDDTGQPSYFRIQMTPETTMSETHGPMDYKKLADTGAYDRLHEEGMGAKRNIFVDEIFDARANAQRNILGLLAERAHAQGSHIIKALIETVMGATNRYLSEVYEKAGDDGPKAVVDRFALIGFVPATFEHTDSYVQLIQRSKKPSGPIPEFRFSELEALRAIVGQVEISEPVAKALSLLSSRMKAETEALEAASLKSYRDKVKNGEEPTVPYRATKYHSPRTIGKASAILKAFIVKDWVEKGGKRRLEATIQDLAQLEKFFTLNGPNDAFVKSEMARTSNVHERAQLSAILQEREIFERHYNKIIEEMDAASVRYALNDLAGLVTSAHSPVEKQAAAQQVIKSIAQVVTDKQVVGLHSELDGVEIGKDFVQNYLEGLLKGLVDEAEFRTMKSSVLAEIERQKRAVIDEANRARQVAEEQVKQAAREVARKEAAARVAKEAAEKKAAELKEAFANPDHFVTASFETGQDPRNGNSLIAYNEKTKMLAVYHRDIDSIELFDLAKMENGRLNPVFEGTALGDEHVSSARLREMHFASDHSILFYEENGRFLQTFDLNSKNVETDAVSARDVYITYHPQQQKTIFFDPGSMKMKFVGSDSRVELFSFVPDKAANESSNESDFRDSLASIGNLQVSKNGEYALLMNADRTEIFKVDFEKKEITPIVHDVLSHTQFNLELDRSIISAYSEEVLAADLSGSEPVIRKLSAHGATDSAFSRGGTTIDGTSLLLVAKPNVSGLELIDGTTGEALAPNLFAKNSSYVYSVRAFSDGYVLFTYESQKWHVQVVKRK